MPATHALIDIGNVLLAFDFEPALRRLIPAETAHPEECLARLLERKDAFEAGQIPEEDFILWASSVLGFTGTADTFRATWNSIFTPIDAMWSTIKELKDQGLVLILFSNTNPIHAPFFSHHYEIFPLFDHTVFSHQVGAIKPDSAIYRHAIDTFGLVPSQTLYVDDMPENITTGLEFGFLSYQYDWKDHDGFLTWLKGHIATGSPAAEKC